MSVTGRTPLPPSVREALAREPRPGGLSAIEHVVLLMGEDRSSDHVATTAHHEPADTFTACDAYHGPARGHGGYEWAGYAERLRDAGLSWRAYRECDEFRAAAVAGRLPRVSYLVGSGHPAYQVLDAVASAPEVWDSTALFITGEADGGHSDDVPPPCPPRGVDEPPLGPRVPMVVVSPWTVGGYVDSQVFDDSSIARFLERWLGVSAPGISAWRRTVCGDLTSAFDFTRRARRPVVPRPGPVRPARPLPYQPDASGVVVGGEVRLALRNSGDESVHLALFPHAGEFEAPAHFDVRSSVDVTVPFDGRYRFTVVGPNGFRREFAGARGESVAVESSTHGHSRVLSMTLANSGTSDVTFAVVGDGRDFKVAVRPGRRRLVPWLTAFRHGWYDVTITSDGGFHRRLAGHLENGRESVSPTITRS
ncbi:phospholipase domain-containing protein [Saccharothrix sp. NRRL B-16348]|uniref:phospholipase domain-containing protein n=1 Tax=Saccharothrix sp. NRRL B-16348 TaxID=1415542 RepID=UPI0009E7A6D7|nr:phospholipase domain-containing protein [Saccharothrix sp. NRRL B-16348]